MPTATEGLATEGKIVQYVGTTNSSYTNGYFYKCVEDSENSGSYIWVQAPTQEEGGSGALESAITVTKPAGGISQGKEYAVGTSYETLWHDLLDPHLYPQLTAPTGVLTASESSPLKTGAKPTVTFTLSLNRGSINPAYGTTGYRSGAITGCKFDGATEYSTVYSYEKQVQAESGTTYSKEYKGNVRYDAGERPKDSKGEYYDATALAAGNVDTNTIKFEFVSPIWTNRNNLVTDPTEEALVSANTGVKAFDFPACTATTAWIIDVPAAWTVTKLETPDLFIANNWIDCTDEFTVTNTTHKDATGNVDIAYKRYTWNKGIPNDPRTTRICWTV